MLATQVAQQQYAQQSLAEQAMRLAYANPQLAQPQRGVHELQQQELPQQKHSGQQPAHGLQPPVNIAAAHPRALQQTPMLLGTDLSALSNQCAWLASGCDAQCCCRQGWTSVWAYPAG